MQERIKQAFESTKRIALHHYESLLQERPTGSKWGYNPTEEDLTSNGFELQELSGPHISPHCTYYKQNLDEHTLSFQMAESSEVVSESSIHAKTGVKAIEYCRASPDIDLVLMDIKLPGMNGKLFKILLKRRG